MEPPPVMGAVVAILVEALYVEVVMHPVQVSERVPPLESNPPPPNGAAVAIVMEAL
jgi:hypothetical protein